MTPSSLPASADSLARDLREFAALCEECLALALRENQALHSQSVYASGDFDQKRKYLLPKLESALINLRRRRQNCPPGRSGQTEDVKTMFQTVQNLVMKILLL